AAEDAAKAAAGGQTAAGPRSSAASAPGTSASSPNNVLPFRDPAAALAGLTPSDGAKDLEDDDALTARISPSRSRPRQFQDLDCPYFREARASGGTNKRRQQWRADLKVTPFVDDGEAKAHEISIRGNGYTPEETKREYEAAVKRQATLANTPDRVGTGFPQC